MAMSRLSAPSLTVRGGPDRPMQQTPLERDDGTLREPLGEHRADSPIDPGARHVADCRSYRSETSSYFVPERRRIPLEIVAMLRSRSSPLRTTRNVGPYDALPGELCPDQRAHLRVLGAARQLRRHETRTGPRVPSSARIVNDGQNLTYRVLDNADLRSDVITAYLLSSTSKRTSLTKTLPDRRTRRSRRGRLSRVQVDVPTGPRPSDGIEGEKASRLYEAPPRTVW